ncbi:MAG: undecaprenyldiphospho-muramoylpentapeptide beta-N-acetylglucosaminyltransferase [Gammaproteobacteria bacterium]|nr:MAG: undecaprenyldiphospho-muramoylpentapeptide beta-N-acetylglucosaminyltransferase [Gammaproteobacteria bacterium]
MILAGGTGGHVFPALAVAKQIEQQSVPIVWVGTKRGIEAKVVPNAGYKIEWIAVNGLRGKNFATYVFAPFKLVLASLQVTWLLIKHRPCAVLGMGGFVAGPGGLIAALMRKPLIIHEQNAIAGLTNRLLAPFAKRILTGFPSTFVRKNVEVLGNPVRAEISQLQRQYQIAEPADRPLRVLVFGGSLGAQALNETVPIAMAKVMAEFSAELHPEIWHQTGEHKYKTTLEHYESQGVKCRVDAFIENMQEAYAWADLVICRAGAITVAELAVAGVGAIFIPYPYAVDDHQTANAGALVNAGAALMIAEKHLNADSLAKVLHELLNNRTKLRSFAKAAGAFAKPQAARDVAKVCIQACLGKDGENISMVKDF